MPIDHLDSYERAYVSPTTRTLLCHFAAGDLTRPLPRIEADWAEVFQAVCRNGLLGLTQRYLSHHQTLDYPPRAFRQQVAEAQRLSAMRMLLMYRNVRWVLDQLVRAGLDFMVVKGLAVGHVVYPNPDLRSFNDLDLIVRERDWSDMHRALLAMGFQPEKPWAHPPPKLVPEAVLYELKYWHPQRRLLVEVHYEDILNTGLASCNPEMYWKRVTWVEIDGIAVKAMSLEHQLVHLCAHAHYHGYSRLNWLTDIAFIIRDHADQIDWDMVLATVRNEEAQVSVYYTLDILTRLLGVSAPRGVVAALRPDWFRRWLHEWFMPQEKLLSLQPMWRPDFSFYFTPLLKRLLPDLLVMGRRRDKIRYLWRLLLPPRDWLRYYYQLGDTERIMLHYLLHPLKLAWHYLDEVTGVLVQSRSKLDGR